MDMDKAVSESFRENRFSVTIHMAVAGERLISGVQVFQPTGFELNTDQLAVILAELSALQSSMVEQLAGCLAADRREDFLRKIEEIASVRHPALMKTGQLEIILKDLV